MPPHHFPVRFDNPTDAVQEHGTIGGRRQSRQASGGADGFAVFGQFGNLGAKKTYRAEQPLSASLARVPTGCFSSNCAISSSVQVWNPSPRLLYRLTPTAGLLSIISQIDGIVQHHARYLDQVIRGFRRLRHGGHDLLDVLAPQQLKRLVAVLEAKPLDDPGDDGGSSGAVLEVLEVRRLVIRHDQRERFWGPGVDFVDPKVFRKRAAGASAICAARTRQ